MYTIQIRQVGLSIQSEGNLWYNPLNGIFRFPISITLSVNNKVKLGSMRRDQTTK